MNRTTLRRILELDTMIRLGRLHSAAQAAAELEVNRRTIERDLATLRDLRAEIHYDAERKTYSYVGHPIMLPAQWLNESEIALVLIAEKALRTYAHAAFSDEVHPAFNRLLDPIRDYPDTMEEIRSLARRVCFYRSYEPSRALRPIFQAVLDSMHSRQRLSVEYEEQDGTMQPRREIGPYVLLNNHGEWQVVAYCRRSRRVKTFALDRMHKPRPSEHFYHLPDDFDPRDYHIHPFDPLDNRRRTFVVLRLEGGAAARAGRRLWHPSQTISRNRDKSVTFTMRCALTPSLVRWVLTLGPEAEVISPKVLRAKVAEMARDVLAKYGG